MAGTNQLTATTQRAGERLPRSGHLVDIGRADDGGDDVIGQDPAIGATDPKTVRPPLAGEPRAEIGVGLGPVDGSDVAPRQKIVDHCGFAVARSGGTCRIFREITVQRGIDTAAQA